MIGLDSYSRQVFYLFGPHFDLYQSLNRLPIWNSQNCRMLPLAFVAGWLQGHWWGFISRNYVIWPTFFLMDVFIALKGSHFWFLFINRSILNKYTEQIFNLRILGEKYLQHQHNLYHVFIDFKKAFGRVWYEALWATMRKYNINASIIRAIETCMTRPRVQSCSMTAQENGSELQ